MRKGFTLIELLAVIVILAIIALIAVPIVINIINDAKEESLKRSVQSYLNSASTTITKENLKTKYNPDECIIQDNGDLICSENGNELTTSNGTNKLVIDIKGKKPSSGTIKLQNGKIIDIEDIYLDGKYANHDEKNNIIFVAVEMPTEPGLYDKNRKLLATWDELVNVYKLNITKAYTFTTYKQKNSGSMYDVLNNNTNLSNAKILIIEENEENNKIGGYAFYDCIGLTDITIPNSVTNIGFSAFSGSGLTSITIPNSVTDITNAFSNCKKLKRINFEQNSHLTNIQLLAFYGSGLTSIIVPEGVTSIDLNAFSNCKHLESVIIPSTTTSIGTFDLVVGGKTITNTEMDGPIFDGCNKLKTIKIDLENPKYEDRNSNAIIEKSTNTLITGCKDTIIPDGVVNIGSYAFQGSGLESVTIPDSVTNIGFGAFFDCSELKNIKVESGNAKYEDRNSNAIIEKSTNKLLFGCKSTVIPNGITSMAGAAFEGCTGLTSITIPASVTSIGDMTFNGCSGLASIKVESGNTVYEDRGSNAIIEKSTNKLIEGCKNTIIPDSVTSIAGHAFSGKGLIDITIPNSVTNIESFAFSNCTGLTKVTFKNTIGWYTTNLPRNTSGTNMNVTNASTNATNLKNTYYDKYWKRN